MRLHNHYLDRRGWVALVFVRENHEDGLETCISSAAKPGKHRHTFTFQNYIGILDLPLSSKTKISTIVHIDEKVGLVRIR